MYIADLHIHSHYSRATSRDCTPEYLELWARRKGILLLGTGDFTHPAWREELREKLVPAEEGLYVLKEEYRIRDGVTDDSAHPRFVITGELSSIYKKGGKVRKVHSVILLPGLEDAEIFSGRLETIGNIHSDGRPILGLDCHDLLEILMELCPGAIYIPAHIWTPHFSLFGAFSGFDTIEECYGDLTPYIHALETGLSSDPPMNWRLSALDGYQLVSNSDAHSPAKLGREANLMDTGLDYPSLTAAIQEGRGLAGTIEFFPEEGKYHYDGHRKCHLCLSPSEAARYGGKCPICGRKLTIGVSHRVEELADRADGFVPQGAGSFESLAPLPEVIAASTGYAAAGAKVQARYESMLRDLGTEFAILREVPVETIRKNAGYLISEGIRRLRGGEVERSPGFDGEYGKIKLFEPWEIDNLDGQISMFSGASLAGREIAAALEGTAPREAEDLRGAAPASEKAVEAQAGRDGAEKSKDRSPLSRLNPRQQEAVTAAARAIAVIAGPGTGKTKTLVSRILYLLQERGVKPSELTAVTFTKKAAAELAGRLEAQLGGKRALRQLQIGTFHAICYQELKRKGLVFTLADEELTLDLAGDAVREFKLELSPRQFLRRVSLRKTGETPEESCLAEKGESREEEAVLDRAISRYEERLRSENALDFDDLLCESLRLAEGGSDENSRKEMRRFHFLLVDEFQDVSPLQYRLIRAWSRGGRELFAIGDPDQAIYGFRGSDAACFERLERDFPDLRRIRLEQNYRSTAPIIGGALAVIEKNPGPARGMIPFTAGGCPIRLVTAGSGLSEGIFAAKEINRLIGGIDMLDAQDYLDGGGAEESGRRRYSFSDIALLYRTHRQAELLELCLRKEGIPYVVAGRDEFLTEKSVRGTICFFRNLLEPEEEMARRLCLRLLWDLPENSVTGEIFENMQEKYRPLISRTKPQKLMESWIRDLGFEKNKNMEKLLGMAKVYRNMAEFLEYLIFGKEGDLRRCGGKVYTADAVTLMTLHGSKGLEFPVVMLCGVRKGLLPLDLEWGKRRENQPGGGQLTAEAAPQMEEERRLFYVGMTRAREELILVSSPEESEFLSDIPEQFLQRERADRRRNADSGVQLSLFDLLK